MIRVKSRCRPDAKRKGGDRPGAGTRAFDPVEVLRALSDDGIDALVTAGGSGVLTLQGVDYPYRLMVETMSEGAATLGPDGLILYCNRRFADLLKIEPDRVVGRHVRDFVSLKDVAAFEGLAGEARRDAARGQIELIRTDGAAVPCHVAMRRLLTGSIDHIVVVVTDLTEIRNSEAQYRTLFDAMNEGVFVTDEGLTITLVNRQFARMLGCDVADLAGRSPREFMGEVAWRAMRSRTAALAVLDSVVFELIWRRTGGVDLPTLISARRFLDSTHGTNGFISTVTDLSVLKRAEATRDQLAFIVNSAQDGIIGSDRSGTITSWNRSAEALFGYAASEVVGRNILLLSPPDLKDEVVDLFEVISSGGEVKHYETERLNKAGGRIDVAVTMSPIKDYAGTLTGISMVVRDISARMRADKKLKYLAQFDSLTGLANRRLFVERLEEAFVRLERGDGVGFAVHYLDLDHFKDINDTRGHPFGDHVLCAVANRLWGAVRKTDIVARFGGDEFAVLELGVRDPTDAGVLAEKILKALSRPLFVKGDPQSSEVTSVCTGASLGIALYGPASPDAETLLSHADVALYRAKSQERGTYAFFTEAMDAEVRSRVALTHDLREAIGTDQIFLVYQPQVESQTGRIVGIEALARWRHPRVGLVSPAVFVPLAERSGLVHQLGRSVLYEACRQMRIWLDAGIAPQIIAVNVSALQFKMPEAFEHEVDTILADTGLPADRLELEITEGTLMEVSRESSHVLGRLRHRGIRVAIDDFGTGYSSLDYLGRLPIDRIKIAQNFVLDLALDSGNAAIVRASVGLAHELKLDVIVEGVETADQLALVTSWGCRKVQGYYFFRPLAAQEAGRALSTRVAQ